MDRTSGVDFLKIRFCDGVQSGGNVLASHLHRSLLTFDAIN